MADSWWTPRPTFQDAASGSFGLRLFRPGPATFWAHSPVCSGTPWIDAFLGLSRSNSGGHLRRFGPGRPGSAFLWSEWRWFLQSRRCPFSLPVVTADRDENGAIPAVAVFEQTGEEIRRGGGDQRLSAGRNVVSKHTVAAPDWLLTARGVTWKKRTRVDVYACTFRWRSDRPECCRNGTCFCF